MSSLSAECHVSLPADGRWTHGHLEEDHGVVGAAELRGDLGPTGDGGHDGAL